MDEHINTTAATVASYTTSGSLVVFGLSMNDFAAVVGIALGLATFCINWYYQAKRSK